MARALATGALVRGVCQATLVSVALVVSTRWTDSVQLPKATLVVTAATVVVAPALVQVFRGRAITLPPRPFAIAVTVFLIGVCLASVASDSLGRGMVGPYSRWTGMALYVSCALLALAASAYFSVDTIGGLLTALGGASLLIALYGLLQRGGLDPIAWRSVYGDKVFASLGNPNFAAAFLGIGVAAWLWIWTDARAVGAKLLASVVLALHLVAQVFTESLQGPAVSLGVTWVFVFLMARRLAERRRRQVRQALLGTAGLGLVLGVLGFLGRGPLTIVDWTTVRVREQYWQAALGMIADNPFMGSGFGGYAARFRQYRSVEALERVGVNSTNDAPHNVLFDMFVSGGPLLGLAYLGVIVIVARALYLGFAGASGRQLPRVAALAAACSGYLVQALISIDVPPLVVTGWLLAGAAVALAPWESDVVAWRAARRARSLRPLEMGVGLLVVGLVVLSLGSIGRQARADSIHAEAVRTWTEDPATTYERLGEAIELAPWEPRYIRTQADLLDATNQQEAALATYEAAASVDQYWWDAHIAAARLAAFLGHLDRSRAWYDRVLEIEPRSPEMKAEAAQVALLDGSADQAITLLQEALQSRPETASWWALLAAAHERVGDSESAEMAACRALSIDPELTDVSCDSTD